VKTKQLTPGIALALALLATPVLAGPTEDAKVLFNIGAQAYEKGDFSAALSAFEQAYRLAPRPGILFSIGQAHRKKFYTGGKKPENLRAAIAAYREYLAKVDSGGRRSDAAEALVELEALAAKMDVAAPAAPAVPAVPVATTQIMVTSQNAEAKVSLDGAAACDVPLVADVKPGKHSVKVTAPGFFDEARDLEVKQGAVAGLDIQLREKPAKLMITARDGAQVSIDGRLTAQTPLAQPLDVEPGRHLISVVKNGYRAYSSEIELGRAEEKSMEAPLDATTQRKASYVLFGVGAAGVVAGGVLAGLAVMHQKSAQAFEADRQRGLKSCDTADACTDLFNAYKKDLAARDDFRRDAGIVLGAALLVGGTGVALFALDFPSLLGATTRPRDEGPKKPAPKERSMDASIVPLVGPGLYGASFSGRF
jgi:hypothetical protein